MVKLLTRLQPIALAALAIELAAGPAMAQDGAYDPLKRNAEAFTGILADALELDSASGPFGLAGDRIDSVYVAGHGLVLEVRSRLARDRNRLNLAMLNSSVIALRGGQADNPFAMLAPEARQRALGDPPSAALEDDAAEAGARADLLLRARDIDVSGLVSSAIVQAGEYARLLREAEGVDSETLEQLRGDIEALRRENLAGADRLRELTEELRAGAVAAAGNNSGRFEEALGDLSLEMEQLRSRAESLADDLRRRSESAQAERADRWREDVAEFEWRLARALCDYGASLRELPADENLTIVLAGLGEESVAAGRADLVHSFRKADILRCASGQIDPATLAANSDRYSY
ncbi:MAG: hypothetical protein OXF82_02895 [Gammaproteobacteria bacterium]|nr:hypothetical protein [Gammaproteobacteria bacterium]